MKTSNRSALPLLLFLLPACGGQLVEFPKADAAKSDAAKADVAGPDQVSSDVRNGDVVSPDVVSPDAANADTGIPDAANRDSASADAGVVDTRGVETQARDLGEVDAPIGDTHIVDAPIIADLVADAARIDAVKAEAGNIDVGNMDGSGPAVVINLGLAGPFAIAATAGVTNTMTAPITHINGNVVLTPDQTCNAVTVDNAGGFGLCGGMSPTITGTVITNVYPDTTTATAIKADLNAAFLEHYALGRAASSWFVGQVAPPIAAPTTLGDVAGNPLVFGDNWFTPGVYTSTTSILITGDVTLDGQGDPNAVFVFQSASSLTTADGAPSPGAHARILLTNGTKASNVWWQVASSATTGFVRRAPGQHPGCLQHHHEDRGHRVRQIDGGGVGRWCRGIHLRLERGFRAGQWVPALVGMGRLTWSMEELRDPCRKSFA